MNNSKPGNKLDPALKAIIDPVYEHDKTRYHRICKWVWACQKDGWTDEAIGKAVELAGSNIHIAEDWWGYLDKLLPKATGRANEDEAARYKRFEADFFTTLLGPNWTKQREKKHQQRR